MLQFSDLMSVPDAARHMDLNPETVRRHIRAGSMNAVKIGQQWFVTHEEAESFLTKYDRRTGRLS